MARPVEPVPADKAEKIIDGLHAGRSLTAICAEIGITPRAVTWWKMKDEAFASEFIFHHVTARGVKIGRAHV